MGIKGKKQNSDQRLRVGTKVGNKNLRKGNEGNNSFCLKRGCV